MIFVDANLYIVISFIYALLIIVFAVCLCDFISGLADEVSDVPRCMYAPAKGGGM